ncbi:hypothetical protein NP233_g12635 [Leucocoprinus birnbaumii]|uniref:Nephrocystin 3-like N-terminal domain-containing protein n=1 Tax=Leucocoprinus birnbaumii TaxID=56174 RepID=A0AAD5VGM1_9AGAR|nr:hypothetical protein NP233_g12635 [Leucocoprinus birnbaumii]
MSIPGSYPDTRPPAQPSGSRNDMWSSMILFHVDTGGYETLILWLEIGGFFAYASRFNIFGGNFYNINNYGHTGAHVRELLTRESMLNAELHSRARFPQPQCLAGTRTELISEVQSWVQGSETHAGCKALWLHGPMGVGKSAVAQTLGLWAEENQLLGAAIFLSKAPASHDPYRLFISIAQQLAQKNGVYAERMAEQLLNDNRSLAELDLPTQFKKLFEDPFKASGAFDQTPIIIVDGLDECDGEEEQSVILRLIGRSISSAQPLPLVWVICSRPEPHIRQKIWEEFPTSRRWQKGIPMDEHDIRLFMSTSLNTLRLEYPNTFSPGEIWPAPSALDRMIVAAAGLFIYASTLIKFIGDISLANPPAQLEIVLEFIAQAAMMGPLNENPLQALDVLYTQVLSRIHHSVLPNTLKVLGLVSSYPHLPASSLANLLHLSQAQFYAALHKLYAVVSVPQRDRASLDHLQFYHSSFSDFLRDASRSKDYVLKPMDIHVTCQGAALEDAET